jgi:hypothetical protein
MQARKDTAGPLPDDTGSETIQNMPKEPTDLGDRLDGDPNLGSQTTHYVTIPLETRPDTNPELGSKKTGDKTPAASAESNLNSESPAATKNIRDCIIHAPDILQVMAGHDVPMGDMRQRACLNKATGMSDRLGIHYQIIPPGFKTACNVSMVPFKFAY